MRIAKNTTLVLKEAPSERFLLVVDVMDGRVTLSKEGVEILSLTLSGEDVLLALRYPDGRRATLLGTGAKGKEVIVTSGRARIGLYVGGVLLDEDYFFLPLEYQNAEVQAGSYMHFEAGYEYHSARESAIVEDLTDALGGYALTGTEYALLRPLPHRIGGRVHLLYLDDRHRGRAKDGAGAHQLCAMFSDDGVHFHGAPTALGIDNVRENSILDAALLFHEGRYYLYYLVAYATHRALTVAVSEDGFSFQKTGLDVEIAGGDGASVSSIGVLDTPTPCLYFVLDGVPYFAESEDLLHFSAPKKICLSTSVDKIIPLSLGGECVFFAQKEGVLYRVEGESLLPVFGTPPFAYPVLSGDALSYIGVQNGVFALGTE